MADSYRAVNILNSDGENWLSLEQALVVETYKY